MTIPTSSIDQVIPGQGAMAQPETSAPVRAKRRRFRFIANGKTATGLIILALYVLFAIIGPWVAPYEPGARGNDLVQPPSMSLMIKLCPSTFSRAGGPTNWSPRRIASCRWTSGATTGHSTQSERMTKPGPELAL